MLKNFSKIVILGVAAGSMQVAFAARQCLALPGTYGSVTVTGCENNPRSGVFNPVSQALGADYKYDGLALAEFIGIATCTYGFSHSIATSSITIDLDIINPGDKFTVELDGQPYSFVPADIVQTPLPLTTIGLEPIGVEAGAVQNAPSYSSSSGTVKMSVSAPARVSTLKLNMDASLAGGGVTRVCIDDAEAVVPPAASTPTPVPSTSTWGLMALAPMIAFAGFMGFTRRRKFLKESS